MPGDGIREEAEKEMLRALAVLEALRPVQDTETFDKAWKLAMDQAVVATQAWIDASS